MQEILDNCLARVPEADALVCVAIGSGRLLGAAAAPSDGNGVDQHGLGASAAALFRGGVVTPETPPGKNEPLAEAVVAATGKALIFLRCNTRRDVAVAYSVSRDSDLGLALANSRLTLPEIEMAI